MKHLRSVSSGSCSSFDVNVCKYEAIASDHLICMEKGGKINATGAVFSQQVE